MKKPYKILTQVALGAAMCVSLAVPAQAQRGSQQAQNGGGSSGGGGNTAQSQRSSPPPQAPAPQPQFQRSSPAPAPQPAAPAPQPQIQRSQPQPAPQPQQVQQSQPQIQRGQPQYTPAPQPQQVQQSQPQMQRNNAQPGGSYGSQPRPNAAPIGSAAPRGSEHADPLRFKPNNPGSGSRLYPNGSQRGGSYNNGFNFRKNTSTVYRSYPGLRYGQGYVSPRPRGFFYRNRGYYNTYYMPQLGFNLNVLPNGYYPFYYGNDQYYYADGLYYMQQENDEDYTVVEPPIGGVITKLPAKAQSIMINGVQYYEHNGVYYQPIRKDDGTSAYQIAGKDGELNTADDTALAPEDLPQVGDLVDHLPEGFKILRLNGQRYYVSQEGYYFQDSVDTNGDKVFKIVGTPYETLEN